MANGTAAGVMFDQKPECINCNRTAHDICVQRGDEEARFNTPIHDETSPGVTG